MLNRLRTSLGNCSPSMVGHELQFNGLLFPRSLGKARSVCRINLSHIENLHRQKVYQALKTVSCSPSHPHVLTPYYPSFATKSADNHSIDLTNEMCNNNSKQHSYYLLSSYVSFVCTFDVFRSIEPREICMHVI